MYYRIFPALVAATAVTLAAVHAKAPAPQPKPEEKSKTDPPGAPLEAKLVVKKATYTLDRRGETAEQYADAAKKSPPLVEVDLVLELKNTSDKEITIWIADDYRKEERQDGGDYVKLQLDLKGPGAVSALVQQRFTRPKTPPPRTRSIAPGKTWALPITTLNYGTHGVATYEAYRTCWTGPGEYALTATFKTAVSPAPQGSKETKWAHFEGGFVTVTTAPVKLKVVTGGKNHEPAKGELAARRDLVDLLPLLDKDKGKLTDQERDLLKKLENSKVPTADKAKKAAVTYKFKSSGILAEEAPYVVSLLPLGIDVADFAKRGDLIWVVQFRIFGGAITQEVWVSSSTGEVLAILPLKR
jgi:hypothetical protein